MVNNIANHNNTNHSSVKLNLSFVIKKKETSAIETEMTMKS
jgi:hypothetical protein